MEPAESRRIRKPGQQGCDIAIADKNLGMSGNLPQVNFSQQIVRAIPAACAQYPSNLVPHKHRFQFLRPPRRGSSKINILLNDRVEIERFVSQVPQSRATTLQQLAFYIAGGRHNANRVSRTQGPWLNARSLSGWIRQRDILNEEFSLEDEFRRSAQKDLVLKAYRLRSPWSMHPHRRIGIAAGDRCDRRRRRASSRRLCFADPALEKRCL